MSGSTFESWAAGVSAAVAAGAFAWGVWQYFQGERAKREQLRDERERETSRRRIEATRPYLEKQLEFYIEATRVAAAIAASDSREAAAATTARFKELYLGEMALVEDIAVERAMVAFKTALEEGGDLPDASLRLSHTLRDSLARSWGTSAWESHYSRRHDENGDAAAQ